MNFQLSHLTLIALGFVLSHQASSFHVSPSQGTFRQVSSALAVSFSSFDASSPDIPDGEISLARHSEYQNLEPLQESDIRRARMERDLVNRKQFVKYGNDLWNLRETISKLSIKLMDAINDTSNMKGKASQIRAKLRVAESQDPELNYKLELEAMHNAQREGRTKDAELHSKKAVAARSCLPQFNLEGLWVGKYGLHGYEMLNITYAGDTLIAYKVTGDKNVPQGEITFQADLNPSLITRNVADSNSNPTDPLQPIILTEKASKKWGTTHLPRYAGLGQVAEPGFLNHQWMDGQLIIIGDDYFSFAWVPVETQIFFGRPSPELALKMLREHSALSSDIPKNRVWEAPPSMDDDVAVLKDYMASCLEKTRETYEEELDGDPFSCIWSEMDMDTEECHFQ